MRKLHELQTTAPQHVTVAGSFIPNGSSAIATKYGTGFSVSRTGTGEYTVTLDFGFTNYVSIVVTGQWASSNTDGHQYIVGDISVTNRTFEIVHLASTDVSATDIAATDISTSGTANKINFMVTVALGDVPGQGV